MHSRDEHEKKYVNKGRWTINAIFLGAILMLCFAYMHWFHSAKKVSDAETDALPVEKAIHNSRLSKLNFQAAKSTGMNAVNSMKPSPNAAKRKEAAGQELRKKKTKNRPSMVKTKDQTIPVYYINLDGDKVRRQHIELELNEQHLRAVRVPAIDSMENVTLGIVSPLTMVNPNHRELACIASHMIALHQAVNDASFFPGSPYAIILEDDVKFEFSLNWNELIYNAPADFDVLQLITSNADQVHSMLQYYETSTSTMIDKGILRNISNPYRTKHDFLWSTRLRGISGLWSTQAYAVRKDYIRRIINSRVKKNNRTGEYRVTIKNTPNQVSTCADGTSRTCKLLYPYRVVADVYLYDLLGVAYTLRLPLLNGVTGFNSTIQSEAASEAVERAFKNISSVVEYVRQHRSRLLPEGLLLK